MNVEVAHPPGRFFLPKDMRRVGRFELIMRLGNGGMATVYLARSVSAGGFQRLVAIKLMHPFLASDPHFVEMFLDEARVAATIRHPNVVPLIDLGAEQDQLFMVMDYIEGDTLAAVEATAARLGRAIPLGIVLRIVLDSLAGLEAAHNLCTPDGTPLKVVHRDVSPQNIIVGVDGASRVLDFGIARAEQRLSQTVVGTLKGKAPFMAPEQFDGNAIDRRADVFSMGVTLWEAVALRRLFPGRGSDNAHRATSEYRRLKDILPTVPAGLDAICQKALCLEPERRFATAAAFADAIEAEFGSVIASHRQVGTFMAAVAEEKIQRERDAIRETASRGASPEPANTNGGADDSGSRPSLVVPSDPRVSVAPTGRAHEPARNANAVLPEDVDTDALLDALLPSSSPEEIDLPRPQRPDAALLPQVHRSSTLMRSSARHEAPPRGPSPMARATGRIDLPVPVSRPANSNDSASRTVAPAAYETPARSTGSSRTTGRVDTSQMVAQEPAPLQGHGSAHPPARPSYVGGAMHAPGSRQERQGYNPQRVHTHAQPAAPARVNTAASPAALSRTSQRIEPARKDILSSQNLPTPRAPAPAAPSSAPPARKQRTMTMPSTGERVTTPAALPAKVPSQAVARAEGTPGRAPERVPTPDSTIEFNLVRARPTGKIPHEAAEATPAPDAAKNNMTFEVKLPTSEPEPAAITDALQALANEVKEQNDKTERVPALAPEDAEDDPLRLSAGLKLPNEKPVVVARFPSFIEAPHSAWSTSSWVIVTAIVLVVIALFAWLIVR
jgi:serine/threonine-protein kinase